MLGLLLLLPVVIVIGSSIGYLRTKKLLLGWQKVGTSGVFFCALGLSELVKLSPTNSLVVQPLGVRFTE